MKDARALASGSPTFHEVEALLVWGRLLSQVADTMIEADLGLDHGVGHPNSLRIRHTHLRTSDKQCSQSLTFCYG